MRSQFFATCCLLLVTATLSAKFQVVSSINDMHKKPILWSILICTLNEREKSFSYIYSKLLQQIQNAGLENEVEVVYCKDNREHAVGFKRNQLMQASKGKYTNFVDDDDDVHEQYIPMIYGRLLQNPDCVSLVGIYTVNGKNPQGFIHSIAYDRYFQKGNVYYRPPNHLNPMRRSIAIQFAFPEINQQEDTKWAMQIARSKLLQKEEVITEPYYFYLFTSKTPTPAFPLAYDSKKVNAVVQKNEEKAEKLRAVTADTNQQQLKKFAACAYSTHATIKNTYDVATACIIQNIPGDFVECGVANGSQIGAMAYACQQCKQKKNIHLFDSFEGIPLAGPHDETQPGIGKINHDVSLPEEERLKTSGISACSVERVQANLRSWGFDPSEFTYHKGWFQHVLPKVADSIDAISFLRLDGDLYESTKVCLDYLYPKMSKGGYVVIDDYALPGCKKAVDEYLEKYGIKPQIIPVEGGMGVVYFQVP